MTAGASRAAPTIAPQPALAPSPQPRPAPTARALPPGLVEQGGQNWTPIGGLPQQNAHAMIRRRAAAAGIATLIGNHTFRATGITTFLKTGGTLEGAAAMANHASTATTQLYDRRRDEFTLDDVERIVL